MCLGWFGADGFVAFKYYISHHLTKEFELTFWGCYLLAWLFFDPPYLPILANPYFVEHYSENNVDMLHRKNLLLGEGRYLTALMLKTFPKRKMVFCPQ